LRRKRMSEELRNRYDKIGKSQWFRDAYENKSIYEKMEIENQIIEEQKQEIDKLRAEVEKLKTGICEHVEQNILVPDCKLCEKSADANTAREYIPKLTKKIEELKKYAAHKPDCLAKGARLEVYGPGICSCGLKELLGDE